MINLILNDQTNQKNVSDVTTGDRKSMQNISLCVVANMKQLCLTIHF